MKVYIVRHGQAASSDVDPQRGLTPAGRAQVEKVAGHLKLLNLSVDCVWHSGKTRAEQTAQILVEAMTVREDVTAHAGLAPNDHVKPIRDEIEAAGQDIMIVSHLPFVGILTSLLLTGSESASQIDFKEATIACLAKSSDNHWQIEWVIGPEIAAR
ncbi:MAG: phosphohistidine phosphatase SixA [Sedimentisphaerales bacterium]|nr:phosphohistidine phosphatase SixA [Sedimentisphaerales bacterium]